MIDKYIEWFENTILDDLFFDFSHFPCNKQLYFSGENLNESLINVIYKILKEEFIAVKSPIIFIFIQYIDQAVLNWHTCKRFSSHKEIFSFLQYPLRFPAEQNGDEIILFFTEEKDWFIVLEHSRDNHYTTVKYHGMKEI